MRTRRITPWLYVLPALIVFIALAVVPVVWTFATSLTRWDGLTDKQFVGLHNYIEMFQDDVFLRAVGNNLLFMVLGTLVQVVIGMVMAVLMLSITKFRNIIRVAYFIPCVISSVAISQIFVKLLSVHPQGVVNALLGAVGLQGLQGAYLSDTHITLIIVTLVDAYKFCAIYMIIYYSALVAIDQEVLEAATLDGCNWWQQLVSIKFPLIRAVVMVTVVMLVSGCLKGFDVSYVLTSGGPGASSELVATYMYKTIFNSSDFGYGSAMGVFLTVECLVIVAIVRKVFKIDTGAEETA
jgi:raffinose/stachyose/melibiose transport system permease protein